MTEDLEEATRRREAVNYSTLSWHIASTALKVWMGCMSYKVDRTSCPFTAESRRLMPAQMVL